MVEQRNKAKYPRTVAQPAVDKTDPMRSLTNEELFKIIGEENSLASALAESYRLSKIVIKCRETAAKAKTILQGRKVKIPEHL